MTFAELSQEEQQEQEQEQEEETPSQIRRKRTLHRLEADGLGIGKTLRHLRIEAGLSQEQVALASRMSVSYISRLETGEVNPTILSLAKIVRIFNLTLDGLVEMSRKSSEAEIDPMDESVIADKTTSGIDPDLRQLMLVLCASPVTERTKRLIRAVVGEELRERAIAQAQEL